MKAIAVSLVLFLSVLLAGCVGDQSEPEDDGPPGLEPYVSLVPHSASGCIESAVTVPVEYNHVQAILPDGFNAVQIGGPDVGVFAYVGVLVTECQTQSWGGKPFKHSEVVVWIEDPQISGSPENIISHQYALETRTSEPSFEAHLRSIGWNVQNATMAVSVGSTGPLLTSEAIVSGDYPHQEVELDTVTAVPPSTYVEQNFLFWHRAASGIAYMHFVASATGSSGSGYCTFGSDTMAAIATGINECVFAEGYRAEELEWEGTINVLQE